MKKYFTALTISLVCCQLSAAPAFLGYLYPAGGKRGTTVRIVAGGQGFNGNISIISSNPGVKLKAAKRVPRMGYFPGPQRKWLTAYMKNLYSGSNEKPPIPENKKELGWRNNKWLDFPEELPLLERSMVAHALFVRGNSLQEAPSIANRIILDLEISPDAAPGPCKIRIVAGMNISNEKLFFIDHADQVSENLYYPPITRTPQLPAVTDFPVVLNGQIMPGETDVFPLFLVAGQNYTFAMCASELSPYLGDAVPGHFQGILTLRKADGREAAFADDEYHHPDPVLRFTAKETGIYYLHVSDSIKRGRADFVYRIVACEGNMPFVPYKNYSGMQKSGICYSSGNIPNIIHDITHKGSIDICGRLTTPDGAEFKIRAKKDERIVFEVFAARLDSPLDGVLTLSDSTGKVIAVNDDFPQNIDLDICRRQCDPLLDVTFPVDGVYTLKLTSRNSFRGSDHFYTLQIRSPQPTVIAVAGVSVLSFNRQGVGKMRFYIQRKDGYNGEATISSPQLKAIGKAVIPADKNSGEFSFFFANNARNGQITELDFYAEIMVDGKKRMIPVIPAEESMQAFAYTHLVVADKFYCRVVRPAAHIVKGLPAPAKGKTPPAPQKSK